MDLHVISFAVPDPPVYGGAIDVWHRLKALRAEGVRLTVHAFVYERSRPSEAMESLAERTFYYPRASRAGMLVHGFPMSVRSRMHKGLLARLSADSLPILFEGTQTTGWHERLAGRRLMLRAHNIESEYYQALAGTASPGIRWLYQRESRALARYEDRLWPAMSAIFPISMSDAARLAGLGREVAWLPPFHGNDSLDALPGRGGYLLYQGDLSLAVNQAALLELLALAPPRPDRPWRIAGRSGSPSFERRLALHSNLIRHADVSQEEMIRLIRDAQVVVLYSRHTSGMKLKLFPALWHARFIALSAFDRTGTPLDTACNVFEPDTLNALLDNLWVRSFDPSESDRRQAVLAAFPDDRSGARQIIRYL